MATPVHLQDFDPEYRENTAMRIWNDVKTYYHDPDTPIKKAVITLDSPFENSSIHCLYADVPGTKAHGGVSELSFEDVVFLYDTLQKHGVAPMVQTQRIVVTLEPHKPVTVEQHYYL